jgi:hypothetical protein
MPGDLRPCARDVGVIAWCSFLSAGVGTMATFAFLDPARIPLDAVPLFWQSRPAIYAVGFFLLWGMAALAASLALYMVRTEHGRTRR